MVQPEDCGTNQVTYHSPIDIFRIKHKEIFTKHSLDCVVAFEVNLKFYQVFFSFFFLKIKKNSSFGS